MERVVKDFDLLKEQKYSTSLWLEYNSVGVTGVSYYFDGFFVLDSFDTLEGYADHCMVVTPKDIQGVTIEDLKEIRELNSYVPRSLSRRVDLRESCRSYVRTANKKNLSKQFFTFMTLILNDDTPPYHNLLWADHDTIAYEEDGEEKHVTYLDALPLLLKKITQPVTTDLDVYTNREDGIGYRKPFDVLSHIFTNLRPDYVFNPIKYRKLGRVGNSNTSYLLEDCESHMLSLSEEYELGLLNYYKDQVKGLEEELETYMLKQTSLALAGEPHKELKKGVILKQNSFDYKQANNSNYIIELPDIGIVSFYYKLRKGQETTELLEKYWLDGCSILNTDALSSTICRMEHIFNIVPLFLSSLKWDTHSLEINIRCVVTLLGYPDQLMDVPFHLLSDLYVDMNNDDDVSIDSVCGKLRVPINAYMLLEKDKTMDMFIDDYLSNNKGTYSRYKKKG